LVAGLSEPNVIDVLATDADGAALLVMVETRPWGSAPGQADELKAKINTYANYVLSGDMESAFPSAVGSEVRVRLDCVDIPTPDVALVLSHARAELAKYAISLEVSVTGS
jgi:hypothetical protein